MAANDNVTSLARFRGRVEETGQSVVMDVPRRRKRKKGWRDHVSMVDVGVLTRLQLTGLESRVLWMIVKHVPEKGGNEARCTLAEIADETGIAGPNVSRIMKTLRDRRLLHTERQGVHHVSPWLAWSGDFDSWNAEAEKWPEPIWERGLDTETGEVK
jgi:hypothetical protein